MGSPREEMLRAIREILVPLVRADGGELYLLRADDRNVELHLGGRFAGCPGNTLTARCVIEPLLRAVVPDVRVTVTAGALVPDGAQDLAPDSAG
jgi:Fe-S cluster biogenesis protein NfuA